MQPPIVHDFNPTPRNPRNTEGSFARLADGSILYAYSRFFGGGHDNCGAEIAAAISKDDGLSWTLLDKPLVPNEGGMNTMCASLLRLASGELLLFYLRKNKIDDCRLYVRRFRDEGSMLSEPTICTSLQGYFVTNNDRVVQLRSGRLIAPGSLHHWHNLAESTPGEVFIHISDSAGRTWRDVGPIPCPLRAEMGPEEPGLIELADRLWLYARTSAGCQWQSFSTDGGETWSPFEVSEFKSPCSPLSTKRNPKNGHLLAVWNDHSGRFPIPEKWEFQNWESINWGRTPLVTAISEDEGRTWRYHRALENDFQHGYCYTAIYFLDDAVLLAYNAGGPEFGGVLCRHRIRRVPLDWLYWRV